MAAQPYEALQLDGLLSGVHAELPGVSCASRLDSQGLPDEDSASMHSCTTSLPGAETSHSSWSLQDGMKGRVQDIRGEWREASYHAACSLLVQSTRSS